MLVAVVALVVVAGAVAGTVRALAGHSTSQLSRPRTTAARVTSSWSRATAAAPPRSTRWPAGSRRPGGSGFHATVVRLAGDGTGDLQVQANVLNGYVNQALASGSGPVTVIGYSAGGVVAWLWDVEYTAWPSRRSSRWAPAARADLPRRPLTRRTPARSVRANSCPALAHRLRAPLGHRPPWLSLWHAPWSSRRSPAWRGTPERQVTPVAHDASQHTHSLGATPLPRSCCSSRVRAADPKRPPAHVHRSLVADGACVA